MTDLASLSVNANGVITREPSPEARVSSAVEMLRRAASRCAYCSLPDAEATLPNGLKCHVACDARGLRLLA